MNTTKIIYADYSLYADTDELGNLKVLTGRDAIENALKIWLSSFPGESIRNPSKGGYITKWLFKPMSDNTAQMIKEAIVECLNEDFSPALTLRSVEVLPDYNKAQWQISIGAYSPTLKTDVNINESMRSIT